MKRLFPLAVALLLAACGSTPPTQYYQLPDSAFRLPENRAATRHATAVRVRLAEPIGSGSLLYQTDAHHLNLAQSNLWAAPLADTLAAAFANRLNRSGVALYLPAKLANDNAPVLDIHLDRFQGSYRGQTEISGTARRPDGSIKSFHVLTPQQGDGYPAMVDSLNRGLDGAAEQIGR